MLQCPLWLLLLLLLPFSSSSSFGCTFLQPAFALGFLDVELRLESCLSACACTHLRPFRPPAAAPPLLCLLGWLLCPSRPCPLFVVLLRCFLSCFLSEACHGVLWCSCWSLVKAFSKYVQFVESKMKPNCGGLLECRLSPKWLRRHTGS